MSGLSVTGVHKAWGPNEVLRGASLELDPGVRGFLGGRNGAGKTTLLRVIVGLIAPSEGSVSLDGLDPVRDRRAFQRLIGYLPAGNGGLYARLTVRQNLALWASLGLLAGDRHERRVRWAIERFDLGALERARVDRISMGQRQRVRLAATFLHEPQVVLLDEPHTSLDDESLGLLAATLDEHHERGGASLWCAPASSQAQLGADRRWTVAAGRLEQS